MRDRTESLAGVGAIVLAAGQGTRMRSQVPKVLHPLAGRTMLGWVLAAVADAGVKHVVTVVGHGADDVRAALPDGVVAAVQEEQRGTGHAAQVGLDAMDERCDTVLVLCGDTPLLTGDLLDRVLSAHIESRATASLLTAELDDPAAYGRVIRGMEGGVERVIEASDATPQQLSVREINVGVYVADRAELCAALEGVGSANAQGEVYLPDALPLLNGPVGALSIDDPSVALGINTRVELAACEAVLQERLREELMLSGVTMPDPTRVLLEVSVRAGQDTVLWPGTSLRGDTQIGADSEIGPDVTLIDSTVGDGATVVAAHVVESEIGDGCQVGPYARLRPGSRLAAGARVGTYVETKNAGLGPGAKVPHLSYIGDAEIGEGSNIGAGNITANYDGFRKHSTTIGARVKTGSDCVFVAPVTLGDDVMTGAGSIITDDVPDGSLGIARARQSVIEGFTARAADRARRAAESADGEGTA